MKIKNLIFSIYNSGEMNQGNINPQIDSSLSLLKNNFYEGKFKISLATLDKLIEENSNIEKTKYQLLLLKADFLISLRQVDKYIELIEYIENSFNSTNDLKFKECKLNVFSFKGDKESFDNLVNELLVLKSSLKREPLEIIYLLNNQEIEKAKNIFENSFLDNKDEKTLFLGGNVYRSLFKFNENKTSTFYYDKAIEFYDEYLKIANKQNIIEKLDIIFYKVSFFVEKQINQITLNSDEEKLISNFVEIVDKLTFDELNLFENSYFKNILDIYLFLTIQILNNKDKFNKLAKEHIDNLDIINWFIYKKINNELDDKIIIDKYQKTQSLPLLELEPISKVQSCEKIEQNL